MWTNEIKYIITNYKAILLLETIIDVRTLSKVSQSSGNSRQIRETILIIKYSCKFIITQAKTLKRRKNEFFFRPLKLKSTRTRTPHRNPFVTLVHTLITERHPQLTDEFSFKAEPRMSSARSSVFLSRLKRKSTKYILRFAW